VLNLLFEISYSSDGTVIRTQKNEAYFRVLPQVVFFGSMILSSSKLSFCSKEKSSYVMQVVSFAVNSTMIVDSSRAPLIT